MHSYDENAITEDVLHNISTSCSDKRVEMLLALPEDCKMIFTGEGHLQDAEISKLTRETLNCLLDDYNDITSSSSSDIGYLKTHWYGYRNLSKITPSSSKAIYPPSTS